MEATISLELYEADVYLHISKNTVTSEIIHRMFLKANIGTLFTSPGRYLFKISLSDIEKFLNSLCNIISHCGYFIRLYKENICFFMEKLEAHYPYNFMKVNHYQHKIWSAFEKVNFWDTMSRAKMNRDADLALLIAEKFKNHDRNKSLKWLAYARQFNVNHPFFIGQENIEKFLEDIDGIELHPWLFETSNSWILDALAICPTVTKIFDKKEKEKVCLTEKVINFLLKSHIHTLYLSSSITDAYLDILTPCLNQIKQLNLTGQKITDKGFIKLINALINLSDCNLTELYLLGCDITSEGCEYLLEYLHEIPSLHYFSFQNGYGNNRHSTKEIAIKLYVRLLTTKLSPIQPSVESKNASIHASFPIIKPAEIQQIIKSLITYISEKKEVFELIKNELKINILDYMARDNNTREDYRNILYLFLLFPILEDGLYNLCVYCLGAYYLLHTYDEKTLKNKPYIFDRICPPLKEVLQAIKQKLSTDPEDEAIFIKIAEKFFLKEYESILASELDDASCKNLENLNIGKKNITVFFVSKSQQNNKSSLYYRRNCDECNLW